MTTIEIKGMDEMNRILRELPGQISRKLVVTALRRAAKPMKDEAVNLAPKGSGTIKRSIVTVENKYEDLPGVMIAPTKGKKFQGKGTANRDAWYARFQEYGTEGFGKRKRSFIGFGTNALNRGKLTRKYKTTGYKISGKPKNAGLPAVEFMQKAFKAKVDQSMGSITTELSNVVVKYLRKNAPHYVT